MIKLSARKIATASPQQLWDHLNGSFILSFDDGDLVTDSKETIFSSYIWEIYRRYPGTTMKKQYHVSSVLNGKRYTSETHLKLMGNVLWGVYDEYSTLYAFNEEQKLQLRFDLAKLAYEITSYMYSELCVKCEEYAFSLDIVDFIQVLDNQRVVEGYRNLHEVDRKVKSGSTDGVPKMMYEVAGDHLYSEIKTVLKTDNTLFHNPLSELSRSGLVKEGQILQCVGPRMFVTDIDSIQFKHPILRGFTQGFHKFQDSLMESRSAAKALIFSKTPLQDAEYFSRKLQFMAMQVQNLHHTDCGSGRYLRWTVRGRETDLTGASYSGDLSRIAGKHYLDSDGALKTIKATDSHLIGQTIHMRSVLFCQHPDSYGVCSVCYGQLSESIPPKTNIGHMNSTFMCQKSSQSVLSTKHLDSSAAIEQIALSADERQYLDVGPDGNSYVFSESLRSNIVKLVIPKDKANNLSDVLEIDDVAKLKTSNIIQLSEITLLITADKSERSISLPVGSSYRKASFTHKALAHIRRLAKSSSWPIDKFGNYVFDMQEWDWSYPFLELPLKHFNMSDHSKDIADILESRVSQMVARDRFIQAESVLQNLFDLVNSKLHVNLAVLEIVQLGVMIRSAERKDYALPKPWTESGLGVRAKTMFYRSLGVAMAYQGHSEMFKSPDSYTVTNRMDHIFDAILCPREVLKVVH